MPAYPASTNVKRILATVPVNERKLQFEFGAWFSSMVEASLVEPPYDTEYKHDLAVMTWGAPDLGRIQVRRGIENVLYIDTEFHRDISRWETEASDWQGESDGLYQNFGAKAPDGMVFIKTFASITHTSSSTSDNYTCSRCRPEYAVRTSLERKYGAPGEKAYLVPSLIIALKSSDTPIEKVICEGLSYLSACHECCGTYLGLLIRGHTYCLVYAISSTLFAVKGSTSMTKDQDIGEVMTVREYLNHFRSLPDILGTYPAPNLEGFKDIWRYIVRAIDLLVSCPLGKPVPPVDRPTGPIIENLRQLSSRDVDIVAITDRIAQLAVIRLFPIPCLTTKTMRTFLLPSGFLESDFPSELGEEYPDGPEDEWIDEEEREKQEEEDMLYLAQKAVLRKRNVRIVPLSSALFEPLIEEMKADH
ncbi:uncharacterized protein L199_001176 [Kwoniella botswanensis]|uniref:uncharacterized protein n=1 Tax=Kwoniella botswanensis TaxID=1268659 RepID=UPI00315D17AF